MQDSNGNQITLSYSAGSSITWTNSSGRMGHIADVNRTYDFTYNPLYTGDPVPHLTSISSSYPGASYTFSYAANIPLASPISQTSFGTASFLWVATNTSTQQNTTFYYN